MTEGDQPIEDEAVAAHAVAADALRRARAAAAAKGLRPGVRPRPRPAETQNREVTAGRDPTLLGDALDRLVTDRGWEVDVEVGSVMGRWPQIVGPEVAAHCQPVAYDDGMLVIQAESTSWATQLALLTSTMLARIAAETGPDTVTEIRVVGPSRPSWKHGRRGITGARGPRDTYG